MSWPKLTSTRRVPSQHPPVVFLANHPWSSSSKTAPSSHSLPPPPRRSSGGGRRPNPATAQSPAATSSSAPAAPAPPSTLRSSAGTQSGWSSPETAAAGGFSGSSREASSRVVIGSPCRWGTPALSKCAASTLGRGAERWELWSGRRRKLVKPVRWMFLVVILWKVRFLCLDWWFSEKWFAYVDLHFHVMWRAV